MLSIPKFDRSIYLDKPLLLINRVSLDATCNDDTQYNLLHTWPKCADPSWTLCDNFGYPFCCPKSTVCYRFLANNGSGCGPPGYRPENGVTDIVNTLIPADLGPGGSLATTQTVFVTGREITATSTKASLSNSSPSAITTSSKTPGTSQVGEISNTTNNALSTGSIVGIVIGILVALAAMVVLALSLWRKRSTQNPRKTERSPFTQKQELENSSANVKWAHARHELASSDTQSKHNGKANDPVNPPAFELDGRTMGELDGSTTGRQQMR